jgi:hypothetical protein
MFFQGDGRVLWIVLSDITIFNEGFSDWSLWILKCDVGVLIMDCAVLYRSVNYGLCSVISEC